jgi:hypothetical protein
MSCPLYKSLKKNGTTFFSLPGAAEDISAAYQNSNYKMYFSKYILLNFPKQNTSPGTQSNPIYFDFDNSFKKSVNATPPSKYSDSIVESLRNYVANQETVIRESRLNNTKYYYDTNALETTTEKIFWKWCKKLNVIDFEPATPGDEYFSDLSEFESRDINDDEFFPEIVWREREVVDWNTVKFYQTSDNQFIFPPKLEIEFDNITNFRVGDLINIFNISNPVISTNNSYNTELDGSDTTEGINTRVLKIIPPSGTQSQRIIVDIESTLSEELETTGQARIVYNKLVRYIGEINGVSNVQEANRSYTEVYAHIPDHTGETPDVLFRTLSDVNYKPNMTFPIIPSQYQPEIVGAEFFNSPIVNTPQNYPGSYFGQFDTLDFTYTTANGDDLRRSGDYFGIKGDINNPIVDGSKIDGIGVDFNTSHYVKMNIPNRSVTNFDQFNGMMINNEPPKDFEFNAILWYYSVEDNRGNIKTNLYGISFLDNPDNNPNSEELLGGNGLRFPTIKKLVSNGSQDGTSYSFNLSLNFNIINENPVETYNPEAINSLFSMNLFNQAMSRLASTNDSFLNILAEQSFVRDEIIALKGLLYTQTDLNTINTRIKNLESLLRLYSTNQAQSSDSIEVVQIPGTPPSFILNSIDTQYIRIDNYKTTELYTVQGIIPVNIPVPQNKSLLINIENNDDVNIVFPNNDKLVVVLDKDLSFRQTIDINIIANELASENKKLDIFMVSDAGSLDGLQTEVLLIGDINLPVFYNINSQLPNSAYLWKDFKFNIDFNQPMTLISDDRIEIPIEGNTYLINNSISPGDTLYLNNFFFGTGSTIFDYSGQYKVDSLVGLTSSYIVLDVSSNDIFVNTYLGQSPLTIHGTSSTLLSNKPYFSLNKGKKLKITRISNSDILKERYHVEIIDII